MKDDDPEEQRERSRPTTPKWWRPNYPPTTYLWEEIRRQRERGGYPWTLLDRDREFDDGDNLYEPVNPPPLYGSGYNMRYARETASLDGRVIDIPPEIDIITSEGLDGLDQPDFHDIGFDGDREWCHSEDDHGRKEEAPITGFQAGIRNREMPKSGETSSVRPLTGKSITFAPETEKKLIDQEVPQEAGASKPSALDQLKQKAGQVKQRISKISLPVRPKFNNWTGIRLSKKKRRKVDDTLQDEEDQEVPEATTSTTTPTSTAEPKSMARPERKEPLAIPQETLKSKIAEVPLTESKMDSGLDMPSEEAARQISRELEQSKVAKEQEITKIAKEKEAAKITKDEEVTRIAQEKEASKLAKEQEAAKSSKEKELVKLTKDHDASQISKEKELAKLTKEQEAKEKEAAKIAKEQEAARIAKEKMIQSLLKEQEEAAAVMDPEAARILKENDEEIIRIRSQEQEELRKRKEEEKLNKEKSQEELKKMKAEEKAAKDKIKEEQKKIKEEERKARVIEELKLEIEQANVSQEGTSLSPEELLERKLAAIIDEFEQDLGPQMTDSKEPSVSPIPKKPSTGEVIKRKLADIDFTKRFKRSRTPPPRPEPPKIRFSRRDPEDSETKNKLALQYSREIEARNAEMDAERLHEPQIYITQPSMEAESETHSEWSPPGQRASNSELNWQAEENEEENPPEKKKLGTKIKGFGQDIGQKMRVVGHDLKKFGGKVNVKYKETIKEIKDTHERKRIRESREAEEEDGEKLPRRRFRFRRRGNDEQEVEGQRYQPVVVETVKKVKTRGVKKPPAHYENNEEIREQKLQQSGQTNGTNKVQRSQVLGHGDRDWESPLDTTQSREVSEEPNFSGNISSGRDSPPGSSMASSSAQHGRRQGVMEEIDSDEFFLRERGISEGEDEELLNRLLVQELRQTFRPTMSNTLNDFDLPSPPAKPARTPRKPPRKEKGKSGKKSPNFQTFPPERPKRKQTPGYISSYLQNEQNEDEGNWIAEEEKDISQEIEPEQYNESEDEDEGIRRVKDELRKIDQDMEDDEGRYEPISDSPQRPQRAKRKQPKTPEPSQILYYNTIAGNEWLKDLEDQITGDLDITLIDDAPVPPKRERRKSEGKSSETHSQLKGTSEIDDSELQFADEEEIVNEEDPNPEISNGEGPPLAQAESVGQIDDGDSLDYMDEAGYSIVQKSKESPKTVPRKRSRGGVSTNGSSSKRNSLKRRNQEGRVSGKTGSGPIFFSLPRYTPRTFHIVPPTRPHRTYSTLKPKRPPRHKTRSSQQFENKSTSSIRRNGEGAPSPSRPDETDRPNTAIGIMQGRPLPPPPRPVRSPAPLNDLDQVSIERMVGVRHYANFEDQFGSGYPLAVEEICIAANISMVGRDEEGDSILENSDINVAIQTDPVADEDFELNALGSFEDEDGRIDKTRYSLPRASSSDEQSVRKVERPAIINPNPPSPVQAQVIFPTRLHLDELEVDFLRVNELTAHILTIDQLHSPHLQVNSLTSSGPLLVQSIQTPSLNVETISGERLASSEIDSPSIPPPQFYQLTASSPVKRRERSQEIDEEYDSRRTSCLDPEDTKEGEEEDGTTQSCQLTIGSEGEIQDSRQIQRSVRASSSSISAPKAATSRYPESDDVLDLAIRLGRAVFRLTIRTLEAITDYIDMATSTDPECVQQQRAHMQALICLLLMLVAGIFLMTRSESSQPRWEFYLPPPSEQ